MSRTEEEESVGGEWGPKEAGLSVVTVTCRDENVDDVPPTRVLAAYPCLGATK